MTTKTNFDFRKYDLWAKDTKGRIAVRLLNEIRSEIAGGRSPVKGKGRFKRYSKDYLKQIRKGKGPFSTKRRSPVNMKLTGEMLKKLFVKQTRKGFNIGIDSEIAVYHNDDGAGRSKVIRRLLPTNAGERFNANITNSLNKLYEKARRRLVQILNRR